MYKSKNISLQGLRGVACAFVLLSHCYGNLHINNEYVVSIFSDLGRLGVCIFFCLSGALCGWKNTEFEENSWKSSMNYMLKKVKQIYLMYIIADVLMFILKFNTYVIPEWQTEKVNLTVKIIAHIFLLQSYIPKLGVAYSFNGPAWYLSSCLLLWLLTPTIKRKINECNKKQLWSISLIIFTFQLMYLGSVFMLGVAEQRYFMYVFPVANLFIYTEAMVLATMVKKYYSYNNSDDKTTMVIRIWGG